MGGARMTSIEATGNEARSFLHALFAGKPDEAYILVWTLAGKKSHWFRNVEAAIEFADSKREQDVYVGFGLSGEEYGPVRRCTSDNVTGIVGLWADIDLKSDAHCKVSLPTTVEDALTILPTELPPPFLILTGNGVHAWWLFREPLMFGSEQEQQRAATLAFRWQTLLL